MAKHRWPILGFATAADQTIYQLPNSALFTSSPFMNRPYVFPDNGLRIGLYFSFPVPKSYVGGGAFAVIWSATATIGNVRWNLDYRVATNFNTTGFQETLATTVAAPAASGDPIDTVISATAGNFVVDRVVQGILLRHGAAVLDTMAASAIVQEVMFEWDDA